MKSIYVVVTEESSNGKILNLAQIGQDFHSFDDFNIFLVSRNDLIHIVQNSSGGEKLANVIAWIKIGFSLFSYFQLFKKKNFK